MAFSVILRRTRSLIPLSPPLPHPANSISFFWSCAAIATAPSSYTGSAKMVSDRLGYHVLLRRPLSNSSSFRSPLPPLPSAAPPTPSFHMRRRWGWRHSGCLLALIGGVLFLCSDTVPISNRRRLVIFPHSLKKRLGERQIKLFKEENHELLSSSHPIAERGNRILQRFVEVLGRMDVHEDMEIVVVDGFEKNFRSLIGGHVVLFSDYIDSDPDFQTDDFLAAGIAHEVGHVIARHICEDFSRSLLVRSFLTCSCIGGFIAFRSVGKVLCVAAAIIGTELEVLMRPIWSHRNEYEADDIGVKLMALAGYQPQYSARLMEKFVDAPDCLSSSQPLSRKR